MFQIDANGYGSQMGNMGPQDLPKTEGSDTHAVTGWIGELRCRLGRLSGVLDLAQGLAVRRPESTASFGASLRSAGDSFAEWSDNHPGPDPHLSSLLAKVGPSCLALADLVDMESTNPHGPDWMFIDIRSNRLRHLLARAVEELAAGPDRTHPDSDESALAHPPEHGDGPSPSLGSLSDRLLLRDAVGPPAGHCDLLRRRTRPAHRATG